MANENQPRGKNSKKNAGMKTIRRENEDERRKRNAIFTRNRIS
jgi:hypothetical protein